MATIKLFESWLKEQLGPVLENYETNLYSSTMPSSDVEAIESIYQQVRGEAGFSQWRLFSDLASKSGRDSLGKYDMPYILLALMKNGQISKKGFLGIGKVSDFDLAKKTIDYVKAGSVKLNYEQGFADYVPSKSGYVRTSGKVTNSFNLETDESYDQTSSNPNYLCDFINYYNVAAFAKAQPQFKLSDRLNSEGYLDLVAAPNVTGATLYLYAPKIGGKVTATKDVVTTTTVTGGEEATGGNFAAEFDQGSDVVNAKVQAEVAKAVELCLDKFPAGKRPDKFTLTSGASTEYNGKQMPAKAGVGPVKPVDDATKNQDLAYRRGVNFMNALNTGLKAKGHPGFDSFEIAWSIGKSGQQANPADRFVNLEIQKNAQKPVATETSTLTTSQTGDRIQSNMNKAQLFEMKLSLVTAGGFEFTDQRGKNSTRGGRVN